MPSSMLISGPIDDKAVHIVYELLRSPGAIILTINSQGGDEHCARAIATLLRTCGRAEVTVIGVGDIQSAAVLILAAGHRRVVSKQAQIMMHESSTEVGGNASTIRKIAKQLDSDERRWCSILHEYTGTDVKIWEKLHADETFITPEEALKLNLATELI